MFTVKDEMDLREFNSTVGFWSGAKQRFDSMTDEEIDYLDAYISDYEFTSICQVNDFIWFESDDIIEQYHKENDKENEEGEEEEG